MGYFRAGFHVTGVDQEPQPNYPFRFIQADALEVLADRKFLAQFDAIHASPPCQFRALATLSQRRRGKEYPDLIGPTRDLLEPLRVPWVMENVPDTPLRPDIRLCGCMFGLELPGTGYLKRERWFETYGGRSAWRCRTGTAATPSASPGTAPPRGCGPRPGTSAWPSGGRSWESTGPPERS